MAIIVALAAVAGVAGFFVAWNLTTCAKTPTEPRTVRDSPTVKPQGPAESEEAGVPIEALAPKSADVETQTPATDVTTSDKSSESPIVKAAIGSAGPTPGQARRGKSKPPIQDPVAREALAFVGTDANAEAYWYAAINDAALSPTERQDLIEDLNEDGLSDFRRPTEEDLPLIVSRFMIIEQVAPEAMDETNWEAFTLQRNAVELKRAEAPKDTE